MPPMNSTGLSALVELSARVLVHHVEQVVSRHAIDLADGNERFVDELCQVSEDIVRLYPLAATYRFRVFKRTTAGKDAQSVQDGALASRQEMVAPVNRGAKRTVPDLVRPAAVGQDAKCVVETRRKLFGG
jgi:hypothetical protein